jgi:hypothetical protein
MPGIRLTRLDGMGGDEIGNSGKNSFLNSREFGQQALGLIKRIWEATQMGLKFAPAQPGISQGPWAPITAAERRPATTPSGLLGRVGYLRDSPVERELYFEYSTTYCSINH